MTPSNDFLMSTGDGFAVFSRIVCIIVYKSARQYTSGSDTLKRHRLWFGIIRCLLFPCQGGNDAMVTTQPWDNIVCVCLEIGAVYLQ